MKTQRAAWIMLVSLVGAALLASPRPGLLAAPAPLRVRVSFQPDCYRASLADACGKLKRKDLLDFGPQIAVWVESADGKQFIDTVMVTQLTAALGLGNRPGYSQLASGYKFPYGKRPMVLPVWAHRRGRLYDTLVMQHGVEKEYWLGFNEQVSSPESYFCRPLDYTSSVDAVSCPSENFNSAKGRFFDPKVDLASEHLENGRPKPYVPPPKSYYPPRNDLLTFTLSDCDAQPQRADCPQSARSFSQINDLDAVSTATPSYGRVFTKTWRVPDELPEGEYAVFVEINKEFDTNQHHQHPPHLDDRLAEYGVNTNMGQPSVVFRVPIRLDRARGAQAAVTEIAGFGDWDGATGDLHRPDQTINDQPGSGVGRLLLIQQPSIHGGAPVSGRVHVATDSPTGLPPPDGGVGPEPRDGGAPASDGGANDARVDGASACQRVPVEVAGLRVLADTVTAESVDIEFSEPSGLAFSRTDEYEVRSWPSDHRTPEAFGQGLAVDSVARGEAGQTVRVRVKDLKPQRDYTIGVRPKGECIDAEIAYAGATTAKKEYTQLTGCFIATAAYGSALATDVNVLRRARDRARAGSAFADLAADTYERSSPPLADALRGSDAARAAVREVLAPFVALVKAAERLSGPLTAPAPAAPSTARAQ